MPSLRDLLRHRTRAAHEALEATAVMRAFANGSFSVADYRAYLSLQLRLHAPFESAVSRWLPAGFADVRLCKAQWLRADLRVLGGRLDEPRGDVVVAHMTSPAQALGASYVMEGATLGLQMVRRRLLANHPATRGADRFLVGYGADTSRRWHEFVDVLETLGQPQWPLAAASACDTFSAFHGVFGEASAKTQTATDCGSPAAEQPPHDASQRPVLAAAAVVPRAVGM